MAALEMSSAIMEVTELSSTIMKTLEVPPAIMEVRSCPLPAWRPWRDDVCVPGLGFLQSFQSINLPLDGQDLVMKCHRVLQAQRSQSMLV